MKRSTNRILTVVVLTLAGVLSAPVAPAQAHVYIRIAPPPLRYEVPRRRPSPAYVWIKGYHRWNGRTYVWVPGYWTRPPRPRAVWVPGRWQHHRRGWYWVRGHWR
jgi:hypothetical protein